MKLRSITDARDRAVRLGRLDYGDEYTYPGEDCQARNRCPSCPTFRCRACGNQRPWCVGSGDPHPDWCSTCYVKRHRRLRGRPCGAYGCDEHVWYRQRAEMPPTPASEGKGTP